ncbi:hydrophobin-251 [Armillaria novae-zelandiae]|uniref:Hydrophobin n=1 Tax=Armillaria novae-zelandiae TaxID=153914 RepID=A0AA39NN32_9AGAR|nr:hydrophobin-251 [Armillaria novae-zelandiae]KAK0468678.1 hydrophobin-251 [Armillaria novae-zelandiae]
MFARISSFAILLTLATATVLPRTDGAPCGSSGSAQAQCCQSTENSDNLSPSTKGLLAGLGVVVGDLTADVGLTCSPISVIGVGGTNCNAQTVCCENNNFNGVVALGCTPINVGL